MSDNNNFLINLIASLQKSKSKKQVQSDAKSLGDIKVPLVGTLNKAKTRAQLKKDLSGITGTVEIDTKINQKNVTKLAQQATKQVQKQVSSTPIQMEVALKKDKLVNDIKVLGQQNSKLFKDADMSTKYSKLLNNAQLATSSKEVRTLRLQLSAMRSELKATGLAGLNLGDTLKKTFKRATELFTGTGGIMLTIQQLRQAWTEALQLDKSYTDLIKVQDELSRSDYPDYLDEVNKKAQKLATTQKELIEAVTEFSKVGYDLTTSDALSEQATILANVGDMEASDSAKAIISGVQAYDTIDGYDDVIEKAQALIDKYNEIGNTASITTAEIAQGVQSVGSVFADANTSVDEFIALLAAGNRQFQDADSLALGLRTSALRIRGASAELEAMGEDTEGVITSVSKLEEKIKGLTNIDGSGGIQILEADGETFRSIYDIYVDIGKVYKQMSDIDQSALLDLIAGKHRASAISATLNNMTEAQEIYQNSLNSTGSAQKEYDKYLESSEAALNRFKSTMTETYQSVLDGETTKAILNSGNAVVSFANNLGIVENTLKGAVVIGIVKALTMLSTAFKSSITQLNNFGTALDTVKSMSSMTKGTAEYAGALNALKATSTTLTAAQLQQILANEALSEAERIAILRTTGLSKAQAEAKLVQMGLTSSTSAQTAANATATTSTAKVEAVTKSYTKSLIANAKALVVAHPVITAIAAVAGTVYLAKKAYDAWNVTLEEQKESLEEANQKFQETSSELENINQELDENKKKIDELNAKDKLTYVEQSELEKLKEVTAELRLQQDILEKQREKDATDLANQNQKTFDKEFGGLGSRTSFVSTDNLLGLSNLEGVSDILPAILKLQMEYNTEIENGNTELADNIKTMIGILTDNLKDGDYTTALSTLGDYKENLLEIMDYRDLKPKEQASLNQIKQWQKEIYAIVDPNEWNSIQITDLFNTDGLEKTKDELIEMAGAGNLSTDTITGYANLNEALNNLDLILAGDKTAASALVDELKALGVASEAVADIEFNDIFGEASMSDAIESLSKISDGMTKLDEAYAKIVSNDDKIDFSDLASLNEIFGELDGFENFASVISNTASTAEEVKQAFSDLTTEYINNSGALDNLTFATADFVAQQLNEMGVNNAQEYVYAQLGLTIDQYSQLKAIATQRGIDLTNITYEEVQALIDEKQVTGETANALYIYALQKELANDNVLSTSSDIQNLQALVAALGGATTAIGIYNAAKSGRIGMGGTSQADMETMKKNALAEAQAALDSALNSTTSLANTAPSIDYTGGAKTADAMEQNLKDAEDAAKVAEDALKSAYDAYVKLMSHREAMGLYENDPIKYVEDLGTLVNDYVYDQETAWDAEEKIYQAREKYLDEWVQKAGDVYADLLDMLDTYQTQLQNKITLSNDNASKSTYNKLFKSYVTEAKKYAEERDYLQQELNDYLQNYGGKKGDDRWTELTQKIADANTKIDETKLALRDLVDEYRDKWLDAIEDTYEAQISALDKYQDRLQDLYDMTGDAKYLTEMNSTNQEKLTDYYNRMSLSQKQMEEQLKSGLISTDPSDGEAYEGYVRLLEIIDDTRDSINATIVSMKEFADTSLDNWLSSISDLGSDAVSLLDNYQSKLQSFIDEIESAGGIVGAPIYDALIGSVSTEIDTLTTRLNEAKKQFNDGLANGLIKEGSDEWAELLTTINETNEAISEGRQQINEYNNALMELDFSQFDTLIDRLSTISTEIDSILDLIDQVDTKLVNDDATFSSDGLTTIALNLQQREVGKYNLNQIKDEIAELESQYKAGTFDMSEDEYLERLNDLKQQQYDWAEKIQEAESNVLDIYEQQKEVQIQLIQDKIDALQKENDEYQKALDLQRAKYALEQAMNNRDTMTFNGQEFEYTYNKDDVDSARDTLNDLEFEKQISDLEDQIDLLEKTVLNLEDTISDAIDMVNDRSAEIYETLLDYAEEYGIVIDESIISAWNGVIDSETGATNALTVFGNTVTTTSSKSVIALQKVKSKVDEIYTSANTTASAIVKMLTPDTTYINQALAKVQSDISEITTRANTARDAIAAWNNISLETFNQTTSTATNGVNAVKTAANQANSALSNLNKIDVYTDTGKTKSGIDALRKNITDGTGEVNSLKTALTDLGKMDVTAKAKVSVTGADKATALASTLSNLKSKSITIETNYKTVGSPATPHGIKSGDTLLYAATSHEAATKEFNASRGMYRAESREVGGSLSVFAAGGEVTNNGKSPTLDQIAQSVGEDKMVAVKVGERILTKQQNEGWEKLTNFIPTFNQQLPTLTSIANSIPTNAIRNNATSNNVSFTGDIVVQGVQDAQGLAREINTRFPMLMFQESRKNY